jgi:hypothetical protein
MKKLKYPRYGDRKSVPGARGGGLLPLQNGDDVAARSIGALSKRAGTVHNKRIRGFGGT